MKRKIITILLSLAMVLALIPVYTGVASAYDYEVSELNMSIDYSKLNVKGTYADLAESIVDNLSFDFGEGNSYIVSNCEVGLSLNYKQNQAPRGTYDIYPIYFDIYRTYPETYSGTLTVMGSHLDKDDTLKIAIYVTTKPLISDPESFVTTFNGKTVDHEINLDWSQAIASEATIATEICFSTINHIDYAYLQIGTIEEIIEKSSGQTSTSLYLPDPYVEAVDGTLHKSSEVNFYNAELHQKEVASIQEAAKDWKVQCRTKVAKKGIRTYCYLNGLATEELYSYIDKGYTVTYDWYRADGKGKKFKYVDSTDKYTYLDNSVKKGKYYEYKVKINLWDEDGNIYKSTLADCTKGFRTF